MGATICCEFTEDDKRKYILSLGLKQKQRHTLDERKVRLNDRDQKCFGKL